MVSLSYRYWSDALAARKVGGIWFTRIWRLRVSICVARAV
jgi:hypothetical protein